MSFSNLKSVQALSARMRWDTQNVEVSSDNLSRSGIPKQTAKKLEKFDFRKTVSSKLQATAGNMSVTHPGHISTTKSKSPYQVRAEKDRKDDMTVSRNNIDPHTEMMAINESNTHFQQSSAVYKKLLQNYKMFMSVSS